MTYDEIKEIEKYVKYSKYNVSETYDICVPDNVKTKIDLKYLENFDSDVDRYKKPPLNIHVLNKDEQISKDFSNIEFVNINKINSLILIVSDLYSEYKISDNIKFSKCYESQKK